MERRLTLGACCLASVIWLADAATIGGGSIILITLGLLAAGAGAATFLGRPGLALVVALPTTPWGLFALTARNGWIVLGIATVIMLVGVIYIYVRRREYDRQ